MKTIMMLLTALLGLQQLAFPQDEPLERRNTSIALELGYYSPSDEWFRKNYELSLVGRFAVVPVSVGVEIDYPLAGQCDLFLNFRGINHRVKSTPSFTLTLFPTTLGIQYYVPKSFMNLSRWTPYLQAGIEFYWALFEAQYYKTDYSGPTPIEVVNQGESFFGYGITLGTGIQHPLGSAVSTRFCINYDLTHVGSVDGGGLGNVGGLLLSAKLAFNL